MIERDGDRMQLVCDNADCNKAGEVYGKDEFSDMITDAKSEGWKIFRRNNQGPFLHFCSWVHS